MSDALQPDTEPQLASSTPRPKRPWTILGRLSKAVREQNWFAVVLELAIVVLGVVIGFQVTSWGQERSERVQEQAYLHHLAADLRETERRMLDVDAFNRPRGEALVKFLRAFSAVPRPPIDSLLRWGWQARYTEFSSPVVGTAEALVSSGDIRLIRNDSLRTAITAYLDEVRLLTTIRQSISDAFVRRFENYERRFDLARAAQTALTPAELDSLARTDYLFADAPSPGSRPLPDPDVMLDDPELYAALRNLRDTRMDLRYMHERYLTATRTLAARVAEELSR